MDKLFSYEEVLEKTGHLLTRNKGYSMITSFNGKEHTGETAACAAL